MVTVENLADAVIECNAAKVDELTNRLVDGGVNPLDIVNKGLVRGMNVVGSRFKQGEMFVPEVMMAAKAMHAGMNIVKPLLVDNELSFKGTVILGTVAGDLHDIGKNLVSMMMESAGMKVIDVGVNVSVDDFVQAVREHKPQVLGLSALLTTTMMEMKTTIETLKQEGLKGSVKVIVGGAPVTEEFSNQIGADGWAPDAASAKDLAQKLID